MKYYIQSAGKTPESEYQWYSVSQPCKLNPDTHLFLRDINKLLDTESFSLAIFRDKENKHLCLLVTRLESNRTDFQGRKIFNYIFLQSNCNREDNQIQILAAQFLSEKDKLIDRINTEVIESIENKSGFEVNIKNLENIIGKQTSNDEQFESVYSDSEIGYTAHNSINNYKNLAKLLSAKRLPNTPGVLVVVTQFQQAEVLAKESTLCWGLSELIKNEDWGPNKLPSKSEENSDIKNGEFSPEKLLQLFAATIILLKGKPYLFPAIVGAVIVSVILYNISVETKVKNKNPRSNHERSK